MLALLLLCLTATPTDTPPAPSRWVTDGAGLLSTPTREALDRRLEALERANGHQVLVWIGGTTGGEPIEQFAERTFKAWKVGRVGLDDGVVLFVFPKDRALRIEVGYGLEPVLPDAICSRIIREQIAPLLAAGQPDAAISRGVDGMLAAISQQVPEPVPVTPRAVTIFQWVLGGLALLGFLVLLAVRPDLALSLLWALSMSRRGGRGGSGGFSGGGGRSGGGGASGRW